MVLLSVLAIAAAQPAPAADQPLARATVQARASDRIVSGVRVSFASAGDHQAPAARDATVHGDGVPKPAKLVEFE
jgi:hypothetical protein